MSVCVSNVLVIPHGTQAKGNSSAWLSRPFLIWPLPAIRLMTYNTSTYIWSHQILFLEHISSSMPFLMLILHLVKPLPPRSRLDAISSP